VDFAALTEGDESPMFITLPILRVGKSRNGKFYDKAVVAEVADQVNKNRPGGILGHISEGERATRYELPQVIWVGAAVEGDIAYGKGYIPTYATDMRRFLQSAKAAGHQVSTSIYGVWPQMHDPSIAATRVLPGGALESIDFAPPARAGMDLAVPVMISAEMTTGESNESSDVEFSLAEDGKTLREMTSAERDQLIEVVSAAVLKEAEGREPGTTVRVNIRGAHTTPGGQITAGGDGPWSGGDNTTGDREVKVAVDVSAEKWDQQGGTMMERSELLKSVTVAELTQLPQAVQEHLTSERERAVREAASTATATAVSETLAPIAEALSVGQDVTLPRIVTTVAELANFRAEIQAREAATAITTKINALLSEKVAVGSAEDVAARARRTVARLVVSEMKEQTVQEAERAVAAVISDPDVEAMVASLTAAKPVAEAESKVASEMGGKVVSSPSTIIAVDGSAKANGRDGKKSAFNHVVVQGQAAV
jgi:hypothetical protein